VSSRQSGAKKGLRWCGGENNIDGVKMGLSEGQEWQARGGQACAMVNALREATTRAILRAVLGLCEL
jgi:hypothetical protein